MARAWDMMLRTLFIVVALCSAWPLAAGTSPSRAQVPDSSSAFLVDGWEPGALPGFDLLNLARTRVPGHLVPTFGLQLGFVDDPLEVVREDDIHSIEARLVSHRTRLDVTAGLGLFDRLAVSLQLPVVLDQGGADLALLNRAGEAVSGAALGDLRLALRGRLLEGAGFGLGLGLDLMLPIGDSDAFLSTGAVRARPFMSADWHADSGLGLVLNVGWLVSSRTVAHNLVVDDGLAWGLGLALPTPVEGFAVDVSLHGLFGLEDGRDPASPGRVMDDDRTSPVELDMALVLTAGAFEVEVGGGAGLTRGVGAPELRAFVGLAFSPRPEVVVAVSDSDGDGLADPVDGCPSEPEDLDGHEDGDGCPEPDNDADGVPDVDDGLVEHNGFGACRDRAEDLDGHEDADGCPDLDNDGDGFPDTADGPADQQGFGVCRDAAEDGDGFDDGDGCPEPDNDSDGVPDEVDGPVDAKGLGSCRDAPETRNEYRDEDGCPDDAPKSVRLTSFKIEILEKVFFDFNKATIKSQSFGLLEEVARVMREAPELTLIQIEGHTDWQGTLDYNDKLSQARADAVLAFLVQRGVAAERLVAKGFGQRRPLVTGAAARREPGAGMNRRVEFVILEVGGKPHSPEAPVILERP